MPRAHRNQLTWTTDPAYPLPVLRHRGYMATIDHAPDGRYWYFADDDRGHSGWAASGNADTEADARAAVETALTAHLDAETLVTHLLQSFRDHMLVAACVIAYGTFMGFIAYAIDWTGAATWGF